MEQQESASSSTNVFVDPLQGHRRYEMVKVLGHGGQGSVILAQDKRTQGRVAIKVLERGVQMIDRVKRELLNHRSFWHDHVIQFYEVFLTQQHICLVMEYAGGGSMSEYLARNVLTERGARFFFQQLIFAVKYCHHMGVANRDIKLENTLLTDAERPMLKICDFGLSKHYETSLCRSVVGTPNYLPPEVITVADDQSYDGKQADVWCCGVMLYKMLFRTFPFEVEEDELLPAREKCTRLMERIVAGEWKFPQVSISEDCKSLIEGILKTDPTARLTISDILMHPWYRTELPEGVDTMPYPERPQTGLQTVESILAIVREAQHFDP